MNLLLSLLIVFLFIKYCRKSILRNSSYYYIASIIIAVVCAYSIWTGAYIKLSNALRTYAIYPFTKGAISTAIFIVVMYTGCLKNKTKFHSKLMSMRAELSIIASILMFGHNLGYTKRYFITFFAGKKMPVNFYYASILSLIMIAMLIPLFITSFKKIRRKMKPENWYKLQKMSYLFYALIWVHVLLIYYPSAMKGTWSAIITIAVYNVIFISYGFLRIQKALCKKKKVEHVFSVGKAVILGVVTLGIVLYPAIAHINELNKNTQVADNSSVNAENSSQQDSSDDSGDNATVSDENNVDSSDNTDGNSSTERQYADEMDEMDYDDSEDNSATAENETKSDESNPSEEESTENVYKDGVYEANAFGYVDLIYVRVTVEGGVISNIEILEECEDVEYMVFAVDIIDDIIEKNSTDVDTISGATVSADAIRYAVRKALKQAK